MQMFASNIFENTLDGLYKSMCRLFDAKMRARQTRNPHAPLLPQASMRGVFDKYIASNLREIDTQGLSFASAAAAAPAAAPQAKRASTNAPDNAQRKAGSAAGATGPALPSPSTTAAAERLLPTTSAGAANASTPSGATARANAPAGTASASAAPSVSGAPAVARAAKQAVTPHSINRAPERPATAAEARSAVAAPDTAAPSAASGAHASGVASSTGSAASRLVNTPAPALAASAHLSAAASAGPTPPTAPATSGEMVPPAPGSIADMMATARARDAKGGAGGEAAKTPATPAAPLASPAKRHAAPSAEQPVAKRGNAGNSPAADGSEGADQAAEQGHLASEDASQLSLLDNEADTEALDAGEAAQGLRGPSTSLVGEGPLLPAQSRAPAAVATTSDSVRLESDDERKHAADIVSKLIAMLDPDDVPSSGSEDTCRACGDSLGDGLVPATLNVCEPCFIAAQSLVQQKPGVVAHARSWGARPPCFPLPKGAKLPTSAVRLFASDVSVFEREGRTVATGGTCGAASIFLTFGFLPFRLISKIWPSRRRQGRSSRDQRSLRQHEPCTAGRPRMRSSSSTKQ